MFIQKANINDVIKIEKCGEKCLPIYYDRYHLINMMHQNNYLIFKLSDDVNLLGFIVVRLDASNNHILSIGVDPLYRKQKVGTKLIQYIKDLYPEYSITLYVQQSNKIAIEFYQKNRFIQIGEKINYYPHLDCTDAYVFKYN